MKKVAAGIITASVMLTSGCATILNEETQSINVRTSNNTAIEAEVGDLHITTPASVNVKRAKDGLIIQTSDDKCSPTTTVESSVDDVFFINILSGGVFGSTTDYASEEMWEYESDVVVNCND